MEPILSLSFSVRRGKWLRLYLLGSSSAVAKVTADRFAECWPRHQVVGWRSGFFEDGAEVEDACEAIRAAKPDVVWWHGQSFAGTLDLAVCRSNRRELLVDVGALFDFTAGKVSRAPASLRRLRCEWAYRLAEEPHRLARRYFIGNPLFLLRAYRDRFHLETL